MVKDAPGIVEALNNFMEFSKGAIWVAHNADFDIGMIHAKLEQNGLPNPKMPGIDTLNLCRALYGDVLSKFNLKAICKFLRLSRSIITVQLMIQELQLSAFYKLLTMF